jgi:hypothetical protein
MSTYLEKRQRRAAALQKLAPISAGTGIREAFWSAPALLALWTQKWAPPQMPGTISFLKGRKL